jgi:hypothetical protein
MQAAGRSPDRLIRRFHQEVVRKGVFGARKPSVWRQGEETILVGWLVWDVTLHVEEYHTVDRDGWGIHRERHTGHEMWLSTEGDLVSVSFSRSWQTHLGLAKDEYEKHAPATDADLSFTDVLWEPSMRGSYRPPESPLEERDRWSTGKRADPPGSEILLGLEKIRARGR